MSNNRAALRYAKAVLSLSADQKNADETYNNMRLIATTIADSDELQIVLENSIIKTDVKKKALLAIFENQINSISKNLIDVLINNKRLSDFGAVAEAYIMLYDSENGKQIAKVTTAIPLSGDLKTQVLVKYLGPNMKA